MNGVPRTDLPKPSRRLPAIKFSEQWDKLAQPTFTTVRKWTPGKETWYRGLVGKEFRVRLCKKSWTWSYGDKTLFMAWLRSVEVVRPRDLPRSILEADVAHGGKPDGTWLLRLLDMDKGLVLTFDRKKAEAIF